MFKIPNPYVLVAGILSLASVVGLILFQNHQIHHFHTLYTSAQSTISLRDQTIRDMATAQNDQMKRSGDAVIKVVQGPREVQSIIKEIDAAPAKPCTAPVDSDEIKNAF